MLNAKEAETVAFSIATAYFSSAILRIQCGLSPLRYFASRKASSEIKFSISCFFPMVHGKIPSNGN